MNTFSAVREIVSELLFKYFLVRVELEPNILVLTSGLW